MSYVVFMKLAKTRTSLSSLSWGQEVRKQESLGRDVQDLSFLHLQIVCWESLIKDSISESDDPTSRRKRERELSMV